MVPVQLKMFTVSNCHLMMITYDRIFIVPVFGSLSVCVQNLVLVAFNFMFYTTRFTQCLHISETSFDSPHYICMTLKPVSYRKGIFKLEPAILH